MTVYPLLVAMMREDGLVPPPSEASYRAALHWWDTMTPEHRDVWKAFGITHVRLWWTLQPKWLKHTQSIDSEMETVEFVFCFEHADVLGDIGCWEWALQKTYGPLQRVRLLSETDGYFEGHVAVAHNESSPWAQKWKQRDLLKSQLPGRLRTVINQSRSMTWQAFAAKSEGGFVTQSMTNYDDASPLLPPLLRKAISKPDQLRIRSVRHTKCGQGTTVTFETLETPEERWQVASHRLRKRYGWSLKELWRHIGGKELLPPDVLFASKPEQLELFGDDS